MKDRITSGILVDDGWVVVVKPTDTGNKDVYQT